MSSAAHRLSSTDKASPAQLRSNRLIGNMKCFALETYFQKQKALDREIGFGEAVRGCFRTWRRATRADGKFASITCIGGYIMLFSVGSRLRTGMRELSSAGIW